MSLAHDARPLLGSEVEVDTGGAVLHGTLLSCTTRSLWLVAGEVDLVVHADEVRSLRLLGGG